MLRKSLEYSNRCLVTEETDPELSLDASGKSRTSN